MNFLAMLFPSKCSISKPVAGAELRPSHPVTGTSLA
jgi:hypothetical protein